MTTTRRTSATGQKSTSRKRVSPSQRSKDIAAYFFVGPFVLAFLSLFVVPLVYSGYLSLFKTQLIGGTVFVAFDNYVQAVADPAFLASIGRMGLFLLIQVPIMLLLSLIIALALDSGRVRGSRFVRLAVFVPYAVPGVVAALMWGYLYGKDFGPISQVSRGLGLGTLDFLSSETVIPSIMNIVIWQFVGYNMIIMFAALRSVPAELYEAAQVDGAGQLRIAWSIKIPAIRPAIMLTVIFSVIGSFQLFNEPNLLYKIAPNAIGTAFSPNLYAYNVAFINQNVNYAAALAFLLGIVIMIVSYVVQLSAQRREGASS
ncbi:carbohydrate ABC transporter permease [Salinibacterium sp. SWN1162]|uniref:carbohydrate ABC transporter permease n=1 Tax=Salinibacterium sp. SWN1162 TaxID=2792053 RepID=UPI0018CF1569|nr:sugar ABC transporter permease [Salinibacterium sp. SWN1162]MBH0009100.1 sugar ABC transporter permease [Salinibacterium sp. SWN1162]